MRSLILLGVSVCTTMVCLNQAGYMSIMGAASEGVLSIEGVGWSLMKRSVHCVTASQVNLYDVRLFCAFGTPFAGIDPPCYCLICAPDFFDLRMRKCDLSDLALLLYIATLITSSHWSGHFIWVDPVFDFPICRTPWAAS
jgi:hypothetical protein